MQDKSIHGVNINNSAVASLSGDATNVTQTLQQSSVGNNASTAELASSVAAKGPTEEPSRSAAGNAFGTLTSLLGKFADIGKLVEAASKAWELIQKGWVVSGI